MSTGLRRIARWATAVGAIGLVIACGSLRQPTGPADGGSLPGHIEAADRVAHPSPRHFRLATFNIHGCKGTDRRVDPQRIASCLRRADFVGLNEVHGPWLWQATDQAEVLGRLLEADWLFAPAEVRWWHYRFGNGVISRLKITSWQQIPLALGEGNSFRNLVRLSAEVDGRLLNLLVTHLDRSSAIERTRQLAAVGALFLAMAEPAVLIGDLNTGPYEPAMRQLVAAPRVEDPLRHLSPEGSTRIDWILTRGLKCHDRGAIDAGASDHPCYWVDCELE